MSERDLGIPHPDAPPALAVFDFLIGHWEGAGRFRDPTSQTESPYRMTWTGRYILDGFAIADEARILADDGALERMFVTYRYVEPRTQRWIIESFDVFESTLEPQAPMDLGGVQTSGDVVTLLIRGTQAIRRDVFTMHERNHFTYRMDVSPDDGTTWLEAIDTIEARRMSE